MALPICPGTESRSIIVEVAAGGAALPATAGDTATDAGGVCGIGDAIIMCNIFVVIVMTDTYIKLSESKKNTQVYCRFGFCADHMLRRN